MSLRRFAEELAAGRLARANAMSRKFPENIASDWEARCKADAEHLQDRPDHQIWTERFDINGIPCVRKACSCRWTGEWTRAMEYRNREGK